MIKMKKYIARPAVLIMLSCFLVVLIFNSYFLKTTLITDDNASLIKMGESIAGELGEVMPETYTSTDYTVYIDDMDLVYYLPGEMLTVEATVESESQIILSYYKLLDFNPEIDVFFMMKMENCS